MRGKMYSHHQYICMYVCIMREREIPFRKGFHVKKRKDNGIVTKGNIIYNLHFSTLRGCKLQNSSAALQFLFSDTYMCVHISGKGTYSVTSRRQRGRPIRSLSSLLSPLALSLSLLLRSLLI